ncbi:MAG: CHAT domain-containing protein, partial [Candidatus Eisenbacteria bacterium]|nr:CHAT domain-containing protein [Candidatus Eisenbacteria bacterium]
STPSPPPGGATRFRSGLALAGANSKAASYSENDGLLLAGEIQLLDLTGMELVVLSACHTGLGEIEAGEGVFGLPRAFRIAGARSLVVSLFAVDDAMTQGWMKKFYFRHFRENKSVLQAYNETMDEKLSKLRLEGKTTHPFYWAGFVAVGH